MLMTFKNYVCVMCAQDFTRKYSAYRHNRDLHQGRSNIVRTLEYVIGRYPATIQQLIRKHSEKIERILPTAISVNLNS